MTLDGPRVGLICEQLLQRVPGGIGTYASALLSYLPAQGAEVTALVARHPREELRRAGLSRARRLPLPRRLLYPSWNRTGRPRIDAGVDVVHATSMAFPDRGRVPLVVTVHDLLFREFPEAYPARGLAFHERALARLAQADLVICPSEASAAAVRAVGHGVGPIRVVPLGCDLAPPRLDERDRVLKALGVEPPYVLWVGTLEPRKNLIGVVRGFVRAAGAATGLNLYLVGPSGWGRDDLGPLLAERGVADRVRRLGRQPRERLGALYAGAAAFVYPSLGEGFGFPVLEAMACGSPVVTSDRSSLPEVAGDAALLCDPTDESSIAERLAEVLDDAGLADELRERGRKRAAEFTWERTARATVACYREALAP